ncbi:hypothetical protein [Streptomyces sp. NPDC102283]|uniref:hypothetical protein n=1 Tax=Streptomyces sp. NPDC102283 TaxID=3366155 RepID=UPI003819567B
MTTLVTAQPENWPDVTVPFIVATVCPAGRVTVMVPLMMLSAPVFRSRTAVDGQRDVPPGRHPASTVAVNACVPEVTGTVEQANSFRAVNRVGRLGPRHHTVENAHTRAWQALPATRRSRPMERAARRAPLAGPSGPP